jgi:hypothetical protein
MKLEQGICTLRFSVDLPETEELLDLRLLRLSGDVLDVDSKMGSHRGIEYARCRKLDKLGSYGCRVMKATESGLLVYDRGVVILIMGGKVLELKRVAGGKGPGRTAGAHA